MICSRWGDSLPNKWSLTMSVCLSFRLVDSPKKPANRTDLTPELPWFKALHKVFGKQFNWYVSCHSILKQSTVLWNRKKVTLVVSAFYVRCGSMQNSVKVIMKIMPNEIDANDILHRFHWTWFSSKGYLALLLFVYQSVKLVQEISCLNGQC